MNKDRSQECSCSLRWRHKRVGSSSTHHHLMYKTDFSIGTMWVISKSRSCKSVIYLYSLLMLCIQYMAILFDLHLGTLLSYFGIHTFSLPPVSLGNRRERTDRLSYLLVSYRTLAHLSRSTLHWSGQIFERIKTCTSPPFVYTVSAEPCKVFSGKHYYNL